MVGYNSVQVLGGQRFLLTSIEAQFLMKKLCLALAQRFHEICGPKISVLVMQRRSIYE